MIKRKEILLFIFPIAIICSEPFFSEKVGKEYIIEKIDTTIEIDGLMAEEAWRNSVSITDFLQYFPENGKKTTFETEIKLVYDAKGLYIYAKMYDDEPNKIQERLSSRDDLDGGFIESADWVMFSFDSRHDHQTGYMFAVNCSGVKADAEIFDDLDYDIDYNSLWYADTNIDNQGWTAEIFLPFSVFNFDSDLNETWGFNVKRYVYRLNEVNNWVSFPLETKGISSLFGHIKGFKNIKKSKNISFAPFLSFNRGKEKKSKLPVDHYGYIANGNVHNNAEYILDKNNFGFDIKYSTSNSSALNFSYNPDFGQVEVDPADINISFYETYLKEKRPFFVDNGAMFNLPIEMFYSRRIGEVKDLNYNTRIPSLIDFATKFSGKSASGFSYGIIAATTSNEVADSLIFEPSFPSSNNYYTLRLKKDLLDGNSFLGFAATSFDGLRGNYKQKKNSSGIPISNQYEIENHTFESKTISVDGVFNLLENRLYSDFQYALTDASNHGYAYSFQSIFDLNKNWSLNVDIENFDQDFDNNDMGYSYRNDVNSKKIEILYQDLKPNSRFQERNLALLVNRKKNNSMNLLLLDAVSISFNTLLKNSNKINFMLASSADSYNDRLIYDYKEDQLGIAMFTPKSTLFDISWSNDSRLKNSFQLGFGRFDNKINDWGYNIRYSHTYRPEYNLKLSFDYEYSRSREKYHWLDIIGIDDPKYIFCNASNRLHKYRIRFEAFLNKNVTWQNYIEINHQKTHFQNWMELKDGEKYPENLIGANYFAQEGFNPFPNQSPNPNDDIYFFSDYTELVYNVVLTWQLNQESKFYFIYSRYWLLNGDRLASVFDFFNGETYSMSSDSWTEKTYDLGISIKYVRQFNF